MDGPIDPALHEHYARGEERDRLTEARGMLEFERTTEIVLRQLPAPPSVVADIGGGPGRYAPWLAERGHRVEHRDLMPLHVDQLRAVADPSRITTAVGDARDLDLDNSVADAVLLLGPIYHLRRRDQRLRALREAWRVVRPGGPVFVAAISRWAPRLDGELRLQLYKSLPTTREQVPLVERTGWMPPLFPGSFSAYCHRPQQLRAELSGAGFRVLDWSPWRAWVSCCTTWASGWPILWTGSWSWTPPAPPSGSQSFSGSGRICLRQPSVRSADPPHVGLASEHSETHGIGL